MANLDNSLPPEEQVATAQPNVEGPAAVEPAVPPAPEAQPVPAVAPGPVTPDQAAAQQKQFAAQSTPDSSLPMMQKNVITQDQSNKFSKASYDPSALSNLGSAYKQSIAANTDAEKAQENLNAKQFELASQSADAYNQTMAKQQAAENDRQEQVKIKFDALDKVTNDLMNNSVIDPNRLFNNASTGAKIVAGIGLALGAIGQARGYNNPNSSNVAMDVLNSAIDRDIAAQKDTFNNRARSVEAQRQGFSQYMGVLADQRQAELAEKNRQLDYAKQKIDLLSANPMYQNPVMKAKLDGLVAQINGDQAKNMIELSKSTYESTQDNKSSVADTTDQALKLRTLAINPSTGYTGLAPDAESARDFRTRATEVQNTNDAIKRVRDIMNKHSYAEILSNPELKGPVEKDVELLNAQLVGSALKANRITAQEIKAVERSLGNPLELFSRGSVVKAKLDSYLKDQNRDLNTQAKSLGLKPANNVGFQPTIKK